MQQTMKGSTTRSMTPPEKQTWLCSVAVLEQWRALVPERDALKLGQSAVGRTAAAQQDKTAAKKLNARATHALFVASDLPAGCTLWESRRNDQGRAEGGVKSCFP